MQRVLTFQMARGIGESSEYVTKRFCFSFLFSVGFLCLLCGFLLGRFATQRSIEASTQKTRLELAGNGLRNTEYLQQLVLRELERTSFDNCTTIRRAPYILLKNINEFFSNLSFIHQVVNCETCVRATVRGLREPDRYVILSGEGDGIAIVLKLAEILDGIHSTHEWRPRRSLIFCVSLSIFPEHVCSQTLPNFIRQKIMTYVTIHGYFAQSNGYVTLSGSDVMRSIAVEAIKTIPGDSNWTYLEHEIFESRLALNIPQVTFSTSDNERSLAHNNCNQSLLLNSVTLAQMISQTIWRLSESIIIQWEPRYFNEAANRILESINIDNFRVVKERLRKNSKVLLTAVENLNTKIDTTENSQTLPVRIYNDLLLDLDKALLCPDVNSSTSLTDLAILRRLLSKSTDDAFIYLERMAKCYEDAIQVLDIVQVQER